MIDVNDKEMRWKWTNVCRLITFQYRCWFYGRDVAKYVDFMEKYGLRGKRDPHAAFYIVYKYQRISWDACDALEAWYFLLSLQFVTLYLLLNVQTMVGTHAWSNSTLSYICNIAANELTSTLFLSPIWSTSMWSSYI